MAGDQVKKEEQPFAGYDANAFERVEISPSFRGKLLSGVLSSLGYDLDMPCGGSGRCGKCSVLVKKTGGGVTEKYVKACGTVVGDEPLTVYIPAGIILKKTGKSLRFEQEQAASGNGSAFIALDIGTTTIEAVLVRNGQPAAYCSLLNPQKKYGADVISRIAFSKTDGGLELLTGAVRGAANDIISRFENDCPGMPADRMVVSANNTMLHLFLGVSPAGMGVYPFTPAFTEHMTVTGESIGVNVKTVVTLPSADAFIGADAVAGAYKYLPENGEKPSLLLDLGTNGEMILESRGRFLCTSSAAGPCFEGANISCGTGGIDGAVSDVRESGGKVYITTVNGKPPSGICGAGLTAAVAMLLENGTIDETGRMDCDFALRGFLNGDMSAEADTGVILTRKDVREFQLAKAAIRTGVELLLERAGIAPGDVGKVFLAGGLGAHIDPEHAIRAGILPGEFQGKIEAVGNSSLSGAVDVGNGNAFLEGCEKLSRETDSFALNEVRGFNERFVENMIFND